METMSLLFRRQRGLDEVSALRVAMFVWGRMLVIIPRHDDMMMRSDTQLCSLVSPQNHAKGFLLIMSSSHSLWSNGWLVTQMSLTSEIKSLRLVYAQTSR